DKNGARCVEPASYRAYPDSSYCGNCLVHLISHRLDCMDAIREIANEICARSLALFVANSGSCNTTGTRGTHGTGTQSTRSYNASAVCGTHEGRCSGEGNRPADQNL